MIKSVYHCDGCDYETEQPNAEDATHAKVRLDISRMGPSNRFYIDGRPWAPERKSETREYWLCGKCVESLLATLELRQ